MMKQSLKARKWFRGLLMGSSLTAAAFVFHACYGTPGDFGFDVKLTGTVKSKTTHLPIKGIKVSVSNNVSYGITDKNGNFSFYAYVERFSEDETYRPDSIPVLFLDIDSIENGFFQEKEIIINPIGQKEVKINVELDEKVDE